MRLFKQKILILTTIVAVFWSAIGFSQAGDEVAATSKIDLPTAIRYAVNKNLSVSAARSETESQRATVRKSESNHYPKIGLAGGVDSEKSSETDDVVSVGYIYGNWNIFNGFRDSYQTQIAELEYEQSQINLDTTEFQVGLSVEEQFHAYLYAKELIALTENAILLNDKHRKLVKRTRTSGLASDTDVMEFELKDSLLKSELVSLKQSLDESKIKFRKLLGEEVGSALEPVGTLQSLQLSISMNEFFSRVKESIPEVKLAGKTRSISEIESKMWRSSWLPELSLETRAGYLPLDQRPAGDDPAVSVLLLAKVELFSGFDTHWSRREKAANLASKEYALKEQILAALSNMEISYRGLISLQKKVGLEAGNEAMAKKYYDSVIKEYKRGYKNSADLSGASDRYLEAAKKKVYFKYEFISKKIELERTAGTKVPVEVIQKTSTR